MDEYFVTIEIAKELKLLGFDWVCLRAFNPDELVVGSMWGVNFNGIVGYTSQPTYFEVLDWADSEYGIFSCLSPSYKDETNPFSFIVDRVSHTERGWGERWQAYQMCTLEIIGIIKSRNESKSNNHSGSGEQEDN